MTHYVGKDIDIYSYLFYTMFEVNIREYYNFESSINKYSFYVY